jgi:hypothetical protein
LPLLAQPLDRKHHQSGVGLMTKLSKAQQQQEKLRTSLSNHGRVNRYKMKSSDIQNLENYSDNYYKTRT